MGAFVSKLPEEHEAAKVQSGNEDGASERIDGDDVFTKFMLFCGSRGGGIKAPPLPLFIGGVTCVMLGFALEHANYVIAQRSLETCKDTIEELEALIQGEGAQDPYLMMKLNKWKKKRDKAEAYLKEHKFIGKLVEMYPPDI